MAESPVEMRVYIGGFAQAVTADDVSGRFKPFGQVHAVDLPTVRDSGATRGFGYVSISITPSQWQRCARVYGGATWKGGKLRVEEAREDYLAKLRREMAEASDPKPQQPAGKRGRRTGSDGVMAEDMELVTAKNVGRYAGWTKNRYGRPVLKYSIIKPNGRRFTYDPIRSGKNYARHTGAIASKRSSDLQWEYDAERAREDFALAKRLPDNTVALMKETERRLSKRRKIEEDSRKAKERLLAQSVKAPVSKPTTAMSDGTNVGDSKDNNSKDSVSKDGASKDSRSKGDGGFESDADSDIPDLESLERSAGTGAGYAVFDDAEEIAALMTSAPAELSRELQEKLANGAFDSSSDDDDGGSDNGDDDDVKVLDQMSVDAADGAHNEISGADGSMRTSAEDIELEEERKRTAAILGQFLSSAAAAADGPAGVIELDDGGAGPQDGASGGPKKSSSSAARASSSSADEGSDSSDGSSTGSSGDSSSDSPSSGSSSSSSSGDDDGSDSDDDSGTGSSSSDSDSESDSDSDSDADAGKDEGEPDAMDVDEDETPAGGLKGLFGGSGGEAAKGGMFGDTQSGQFLFTEMLGLEADERSAALEAEADSHMGPVTGGARMDGIAERNLNANRLPMFFPDVDAPTFRRPEAAFQRQKTEEELEADLDGVRRELTDEYKAQQRAAQRKARKLYERQPKGPTDPK